MTLSPPPSPSLSGKHALVTGGGRGIGAAIARQLLAEGASVTLLGRDAATLDATVTALQSHRLGDASLGAVCADIADPASVEAAFAAATGARGAITVLVNNAGQAHSAPFGKTDLALWQRMLDVNLTGTFLCTQAALPAMLEAGWGRIVNVASTAGLIGYGYVSAYCAAKHGVIGLTRALALELAAKGITVNAVCPATVDTGMVHNPALYGLFAPDLTDPSKADVEPRYAAMSPMGVPWVAPGDITNAVMFLVSDDARYISGSTIDVSTAAAAGMP